ncbi:MAG: VirB4 family type IV secretion/conjugal transfer ATPase [Phenylobacterium sp.]|uniref:VirB4 family type IV secretion/conjugal transfer ATPase n=1 Tax=Phenylobacterium sp. TaxID=1871053 RepID=UPI0027355983|nr:VirB4 family type IV secretion/conjugal transfer ATPase [Phenylobacterium sp.]MDP3115926.1 VirB4 family type IV secretion/conjugal transfer ATPase [Phenylobacterium sp.]
MASLLLQPRAGQSTLARELDPRGALPYARHVTGEIIGLDTQALMMTFQLDGASFETADVRDLNDWHAKLNSAWRNLANDHLAVWYHLVRRRHEGYPEGSFRSGFAVELDAQYQARLGATQMFVNELYVTLVLHPGRDAAERAGAWINRRRRSEGDEEEAVKRLQDAGRDLAQYLSRYGVRTLGLYERDGGWFSEPLEVLRLVLTGRRERVPLIRGHLGSAIYSARVIFGREALEIRDAADARFAGIFGVKEYPAVTRPGLWNGLLSARFAFVASQSFSFLSKTAARAVMERKQNQMLSARDRAASQITGLGDALDDLMSNRFAMGDHQASVLVYGDDPRQLADNLSGARALLADSGLVTAREDLALEAAFWAQFPGNFGRRVRPAAITSRNFAALAPFHTHPAGRAEGNHWGPAVALLRTSAGSPFHFNFHVGDLGHTFICGPSGSGKTVVQNFMLAALEKFGAQEVFIDKDRGAEIFVRACGGTYLTLRNGEPTGFAPLKALDFTPGAAAFLGLLIRQLVGAGERPLSVQEEHAIDEAIVALGPLPPAQRSLSALRALLGQRDAGGVGARLEKWCRGGALGWVLDNEEDALGLDARFLGFDMTHVLDNAEVRTPMMMYLFHRLAALVDGRRLVIDIDEFWKALGDEAFRGLAQDGLKTYRKQNAFMVFGTQSPADVLRSPIAHTILEQCATKIFLPNAHAAERDYVDGFGLTRREFALVREELAPESRQFLIKQGLNSVVAELRLDGLDDQLAVLSGRTETVDLLDRIRARVGDDPNNWLEPFHRERRMIP